MFLNTLFRLSLVAHAAFCHDDFGNHQQRVLKGAYESAAWYKALPGDGGTQVCNINTQL